LIARITEGGVKSLVTVGVQVNTSRRLPMGNRDLPDPWRSPDLLAAALGMAVPADALTPEEKARLAFCLRALDWRETEEGWRPGPASPPGDPALLAEMLREIAILEGRLSAEAIAARLGTVMTRAIARLRAREDVVPRRLRAGSGEIRIEERRQPYTGYFAVEERRLRHRRFDGRLSAPLERSVFASGDAVTVLPYDPRRDAVLLIEQFRAGPHARGDRLPWCLEAVAGRCDALESLEETVRREAREEAGLALGRLERVLGYYPTPAIAAEHITAFIGEADLGREAGLFGLADENEDIRAFVVTRAAAEAALASGEVNNGPLAISLLWLALNAERLRRDWCG
jgi:ADP-ribose pyrophosphatase